MDREERQTTIAEELIRRPELVPLLDVNAKGEVECFGWVSPIYEFPKELMEDALRSVGKSLPQMDSPERKAAYKAMPNVDLNNAYLWGGPKMDIPEQPVSLLKELNLMPFPDDSPIGQEPYFTGWKYTSDGDGTGVVGQIVQRIPTPPERSGHWAAYCNLPGLEVGMVPEGGVMNIGTERLTEKMGVPQMRGLLIAGLAKLKAFVEAEVANG